VDICAEELGNNTNNCIKIQADLKSFCEQVNEYLENDKTFELNINNWWKTLKQKVNKNKAVIQAMADDTSVPLNYYAAYAQVFIF